MTSRASSTLSRLPLLQCYRSRVSTYCARNLNALANPSSPERPYAHNTLVEKDTHTTGDTRSWFPALAHPAQSRMAPVVVPRQERTTGAAGASEPLCIAQGAAANVPKFPRRHPHHHKHAVPPHHTPTSCTRRLLHLQTPPQLRTTFNAPTPTCLLYDSPPRPPMPQAHEVAAQPTTPASSHWDLR
jgi:hypothetical protein